MKATTGFLLCISALGATMVVGAATPAPVEPGVEWTPPQAAVQYGEVQSVFDAKCVS